MSASVKQGRRQGVTGIYTPKMLTTVFLKLHNLYPFSVKIMLKMHQKPFGGDTLAAIWGLLSNTSLDTCLSSFYDLTSFYF